MPNETKKEIVEKILELSKKYPSYGASRLAHELGNNGKINSIPYGYENSILEIHN